MGDVIILVKHKHEIQPKKSIKVTYQLNMTRHTIFLHNVYLSSEVFSWQTDIYGLKVIWSDLK